MKKPNFSLNTRLDDARWEVSVYHESDLRSFAKNVKFPYLRRLIKLKRYEL